MIQPERIQRLNNQTAKNRDYVLYGMQAAQRAEDNHALEHAIAAANLREKTLLVCFRSEERRGG